MYFVVPQGSAIGIDGKTMLDEGYWENQVTEWERLLQPNGVIERISAVPITYFEMDAMTYLASDRLDLDHLSSGDASL